MKTYRNQQFFDDLLDKGFAVKELVYSCPMAGYVTVIAVRMQRETNNIWSQIFTEAEMPQDRLAAKFQP